MRSVWLHLTGLARQNRASIRFCLLFASILGALAIFFYLNQPLFAAYYIRPMTYLAWLILHLVGIESAVDITGLGQGHCDLVLNRIAYRVKHECTGLFANAIFLSAVLAYPAAWGKRITGALMGASAFYAFGILRIVLMAFVAVISPAHIHVFHIYVMVVVSLGFAVALWIYWIDAIYETSTAVSG